MIQFSRRHPLVVFLAVSVFVFVALLVVTEERHVFWAVGAGLCILATLWLIEKIQGGGVATVSSDDIIKSLKYKSLDSAAFQLQLTDATIYSGEEIAAFLLRDPQVTAAIFIGSKQNRTRRWGRQVFSFIIPEELLQTLNLDSITSSEIERALLEKAGDILVVQNSGLPQDQREEEDAVRIVAAKTLSFEVLIKEYLPRDFIYWRSKTEISGTAPISHVLECGDGGAFCHWEETASNTAGAGPIKSSKLLTNSELSLFCAPETFQSRLTDHMSTQAGEFPIKTIGENGTKGESLRKHLKLTVLKYNPPLSTAGLRRVGRKGSMRAVGVVYPGRVQEFPDQQFRQELYTSATMVFGSSPSHHQAGQNGHNRVQEVSPLLNSLFTAHTDLSRIVNSAGNFVIEYRPIMEGSSIAQYQLRPKQGRTEFFRRQPNHHPEAWRDPRNYREIKHDDFSKIPSDCYVRTFSGDGTEWVCLHVDIGSPGVNDNEFGNDAQTRAIDDTQNLRSTFQLFAVREGMLKFEIGNKTANGLVAEALTKDGRDVFAKLLDPIHASKHNTAALFDRLSAARITPPSAIATYIDDDGRRDRQGNVLIFVTSRYITAADLVVMDLYADLESRAILCFRIAEFAKLLLNAGIVCPDWALADTGIVPEEETSDGESRIFVVDYGSYMSSDQLSPNFNTRKPEYMGPENWVDTLPFLAEPYMVFGIGILFYQVLSQSPAGLPEQSFQQPPLASKSKDSYNQTLKSEIAAAFESSGAEGFAELVQSMLTWSPQERPSLNNILNHLKQYLGL